MDIKKGILAMLVVIAMMGMTMSSVMACGSDSNSDSYSKSVLGSTINLYSAASGVCTYPNIYTVRFTGEGSSEAYWLGTSPWDADKITLTSQVKISGVSVSISVPPGAGFSASGDTATYSDFWEDVWYVSHEYENLRGESNVALYDYDQNDASRFRFGQRDYSIYTYVDLDL